MIDFKGKRIALAASFGTDINELNESDINVEFVKPVLYDLYET